MNHEQNMRQAIRVARQAMRRGELPFAAVLADPDGQVVLEEHDRVEELHDLTQHAETRLVKTACSRIGPDLTGYTLYTTCEPCAMCFTTAWLARVSRIVYGTTMEAVHRRTGGQVREIPITAVEMNRLGGRTLELVEDVLATECLSLFRDNAR